MGYPTQLNQLTVAAKFHTAANESYPCFSHEPENRLESFCLLGKSVNTFGRRRFPDDGTILRRDEIKQKRAERSSKTRTNKGSKARHVADLGETATTSQIQLFLMDVSAQRIPGPLFISPKELRRKIPSCLSSIAQFLIAKDVGAPRK